MNKYFTVSVIVAIGLVIAFTVCAPELLATNKILIGFVNEEILNILAVMATVTIASAANIHLAFNRLEERAKKTGVFDKARKEINESALVLVWLFIATVVFLIVKAFSDELRWTSFWNGACMIVLLVNVFVLIDITSAVFRITPYQGPSDE